MNVANKSDVPPAAVSECSDRVVLSRDNKIDLHHSNAPHADRKTSTKRLRNKSKVISLSYYTTIDQNAWC